VLGVAVNSSQLAALQFPESLSADPKFVDLGGKGQRLYVEKTKGGDVLIHFNFEYYHVVARVIAANVVCSNGIVHIIDRVILLPDETARVVRDQRDLRLLLDAVVKAGLADALDTTAGITLFAPTDRAFIEAGIDIGNTSVAVLKKVLTYHVVPAVAYSTDVKDGEVVPTLEGGKLTLKVDKEGVHVNDARVIAANLLLKNGVAHVIDKVLMPPAALTDPTKTIVENAVATPNLKALVGVLSSKGYEPLLKALNGPGHFTVFAPDNAAFQAARINVSAVEAVTAILNYHVLGVAVNSSQLAALQFPETLSADPKFVDLGGKGQRLYVEKTERGDVLIHFNFEYYHVVARVITPNVVCSNGIVHIIDRVILLPDETARVVRDQRDLRVLLEAVVKAKLADALDTTAGITLFAPTDRAFYEAGINVSATPADVLAKVLKYHVVPAVAYSVDVKDGEVVPTLEGDKLTLHVDKSGVHVNNARVIAANVLLKNGVAHVVDKVLMPPKY